MSASLSQVRRGGMRPNVPEDDDCCKYKLSYKNQNSNNDKINMNDSRGDCSCHKQRHRCNRLTCYRNNYNNNSSRGMDSSRLFNPSKTLPLFIKLAVLMLAMPIIDAAILKRNVAETSTTNNVTTTNINNTPDVADKQIEYTTANTPVSAEGEVTTYKITTFNNDTPSISVEKIDLTTATTPLLADTQTAIVEVENKQSPSNSTTNAEVSISNGLNTTTVEADVSPAVAANTPQDVNNEINHNVVGVNIATEIRVEPDFLKPKFDYTETLLDGNLEENIRNSVKNEIEFEHDIGAAVIEQLQEVTDPEERQKLSDEILAIQYAQQHNSTKANTSEAVDVSTGVTSNDLSTVVQQQSVRTESASTSTTAKDLSIYFPAKLEEQAATEKYLESNQRNARNLNEKSEEKLEILHETENYSSDLVENEKMQNIEEEKINDPNELPNENKKHIKSTTEIADTGLYPHEANEITEDDSVVRAQEETNEPGENIGQNEQIESESKENGESVTSKSVITTEVNELAVTPAQDNEMSIVWDENLNSTHESIETEQISVVGSEEIQHQVSDQEVKMPEEDEEALSIVLDENLSATEPVIALAKEQLEHLLNLNVSEPLLIEEVDTTLEPETVKSVHIVIKKQGVELEEDTDTDETTIHGDLVNETTVEDENEIGETTVKILADSETEADEVVQAAQNDAAAKEEATTETDGTLDPENENTSDELNDKTNEIHTNDDERNVQGQHIIVDTTDPTSNELDAKFEIEEQAVHTDKQHALETHNEHTDKSLNAQNIEIVSEHEAAEDTTTQAEIEDINKLSEESITHSSTTQTPAIGTTQTHASSSDFETTTLKEFEVYEDNTDDPDIVPILVGVNGDQGDLTASTKGSRSINTQTHHSMLLTQMDDAMAATLFETFPPQNAGQMFNDHLAAESSGGRIGKPLPDVGIREASTSASLFSGSGLIIVLCASIAFMFLLASVVAFVISFQRQRGTLDIEMQEQRCGKDNLDEEDETEVGACTKLLEIELPKSTIVASSEELEECL